MATTLAAMTVVSRSKPALVGPLIGLLLVVPVAMAWAGLATMGTDGCVSGADQPICSSAVVRFVLFWLPFTGIGLGLLLTLVGGGVAIRCGRRARPWIAGSWGLVVLAFGIAVVTSTSSAIY